MSNKITSPTASQEQGKESPLSPSSEHIENLKSKLSETTIITGRMQTQPQAQQKPKTRTITDNTWDSLERCGG